MQPSNKAVVKNNQILPSTNSNSSVTGIKQPDKNFLRRAIENSSFRSPEAILQLQQTYGNKAVHLL